LTRVSTPPLEAITTASHIPTKSPTSTTPDISEISLSNDSGLDIVGPNEQSRMNP